jgi:hypothetical protein
VGERLVVDERRDALSLALDDGSHALLARSRKLDGPPREVDVRPFARQPVGKCERRVAERPCQRVPETEGLCSSELDDELRHRAPGEAAPEQAGEEGERDDQEREPEDQPGGVAERVIEDLAHREDHDQGDRDRTGPEERRDRPPPCSVLRAPALSEHADHEQVEHGSDTEAQVVERVPERIVVGEQRRVVQDSDVEVDRDDEGASDSGTEPSRRERQQQVGEDGDVERPHPLAEGAEPLRVEHELELPHAPEEADERHQRAGPVVRPEPPGNQPGPDERPPDEQRERGLPHATRVLPLAEDQSHVEAAESDGGSRQSYENAAPHAHLQLEHLPRRPALASRLARILAGVADNTGDAQVGGDSPTRPNPLLPSRRIRGARLAAKRHFIDYLVS